ncbi:MAG: GIY-YIG nuclease family protein [Porticoccaceae bacterium]|jgi:putative endonuclease|nr:GIY-YIG nuclease family protein [Porticoccaceae bacterium]
MSEWHLYLIRTGTGALYTGISNDVGKRLEAHRLGRGSKFLRAQESFDLVYQCPIGDRSLASKAEYRLKQLDKVDKEQIVKQSHNRAQLLQKLGIEEEIH